MKLFLIYIFLIGSCFADDVLKSHLVDSETGGLERILKERYIRVLTTKNAFDYYIYQGHAKGNQYEMVKKFIDFLNKKFLAKRNQTQIVFEMIPVDYEQLIPMLVAGKGDIIASGMTVTSEREKLIDFSIPYRFVDEVILTRGKFSSLDWKKGTFSIRESSSYYEALIQHPSKPKIDIVSEGLHTENIMELVSLGRYNYTIADSYLAKNAQKVFKDLVILKDRPFGKKLPIAWGIRKEDKELLNWINAFIPLIKKGTMIGNILDRKYFKDMGRIQSKDFNLKTSTLSKYDNLIKKYSKKFGFDWRLIAALCYQESRFRAGITNKWGAIGLFQIKQMTANEPYINIREITGVYNVENNIHAGVKYLSWIKKRYFDTRPDMRERDRIRMTIAAYNAGPGRLLQAIKRAKKMNLNSNKWFKNVELGMLSLGKKEPVLYMSEINKRYVSYTLLGIK
jgi:membrane-bound lytic murein transglycosylase MltF